jgi:hypothetical protein
MTGRGDRLETGRLAGRVARGYGRSVSGADEPPRDEPEDWGLYHAHYEVEDLADLRSALAELAYRERVGEPNYPLCCLFLFDVRGRSGAALAGYLRERFLYLDELTGDDLLVFTPHDAFHDPLDGQQIVPAVVQHLGVSRDALPCAVFFVPLRERTDRLVLRLKDYLAGLEEDDVVGQGLHAIAEAARRAAGEPADVRLSRLRSELVSKRPPTAAGTASGPDELRDNVSVAASVIGALASVAQALA